MHPVRTWLGTPCGSARGGSAENDDVVQIATALQELHVMGHVYYAMKPSNVVLLLPERKWALSDFGCVARKGVPPFIHCAHVA